MQSGLDHPLLKNHTIQMKPSVSRTKLKSQIGIKKIQKQKIPCPDGTIPVLRNTKEFITNAQVLADKHFHPLTADSPGTHISGVRSHNGPYRGVEASFEVVSVDIAKDQASYSQIYIGSGSNNEVNFISAGWMVNPSLFGDGRTWTYGFWKVKYTLLVVYLNKITCKYKYDFDRVKMEKDVTIWHVQGLFKYHRRFPYLNPLVFGQARLSGCITPSIRNWYCNYRIFKMFLTEIYLFCYTLEIVDQNEPKLYLQWHTLFKAMPWGVNKNWYGGLFCGAGSGCGGSGVIDVVGASAMYLMTFRLIILQEVDGYICRYNKNSHAILHLSRDRGCRQVCCKFLMLVVAFHNNLNSKYLLESQNHHQPI
ncbi:unnamed protein product [Brassica oleracea]